MTDVELNEEDRLRKRRRKDKGDSTLPAGE